MALEGTIKDFGLADILQLIGLQRKTGFLTLDDDTVRVTVNFLEGTVVGADTSERNLEDLLGSVLVRTGRVTEAQLQEALRIQKRTLQRLGYILVKQNFISDADLEDALRIQVTQIIYRLFRWRAAKYQFVPMNHMEFDHEHFKPLSAETILMEGARMLDEWPLLERRIKSPATVYRKTAAGSALDVPVASLLDDDIDFDFQDSPERDDKRGGAISISPEEREVLHMVDGTATVQDIVDTSALAEFDIYRILFELLGRDLIEEVQVEADAGIVGRDASWRRWASVALQGLVIALAALGVSTLHLNPLTPWRLAAHGRDTELLKTYAGRNRIERVEQAIQAYYLDRGAMPEGLDELRARRYLAPEDLVDPWGAPYVYHLESSAYEIAGTSLADGSGTATIVRHPFSASQRMVLEGGAADRMRSIRP